GVGHVLAVGRPARLAGGPLSGVGPDVVRVGCEGGPRRRGPRAAAADPGLARHPAAPRGGHLEYALHPGVQGAMELVGAGRELLHSANRSRLVGADEVASALALVAHRVVLRGAVAIAEGQRV